MMNITISQSSWHFRLLDRLDYLPRTYDCETGDTVVKNLDTCKYTRAMIKALGLVMFTAFAAGVIIISVADAVAWIACGIMHHFVAPNAPAFVIVVGSIILMFIATGYWVHDSLTNNDTTLGRFRGKVKHGVDSETMRTLYRHIHDKTCAKITVK